MFDKFNLFKIIHLSLVSLFCGFLLFDLNNFSTVFFDTKGIDAFVVTFLFSLSFSIFHFYWKAKTKLKTSASFLFILVVASIGIIKNSILLYPGLLELVKYSVAILAGLCLSIALYASTRQRAYANLLTIIVFLMLGLVFGYTTNGYVLTFFVLLDAFILFFFYPFQWKRNPIIGFSALFTGVIIASVLAPPSQLYPSQKYYRDRVIFSTETPFQKIDITSWKGHHWIYSNNVIQFSTLDEPMYYEPMVHPVMNLVSHATNILIVGGENGIVIRELKKYSKIGNIDLIPIDTGLLSLAKIHPVFKQVNEKALDFDKISLWTVDAFRHLENQENQFDVVIIDTPDPVDLETNRYYTKEFYELCFRALTPKGVMVTQAGSPYYATKAFQAISNVMDNTGFTTLPIHNQVLSMGEWGWIIGSKSLSKEALTGSVKAMKFESVDTKWINNEAVQMMVAFGKPYVISDSIEINSLKKPVIHEYYTSGTWNFE
ncbi:MAG: spermidine synthase [Bacteroidia bacterium]